MAKMNIKEQEKENEERLVLDQNRRERRINVIILTHINTNKVTKLRAMVSYI